MKRPSCSDSVEYGWVHNSLVSCVMCVVAAMPLLLASCGSSPAAKGNPKVTQANFDQIDDTGMESSRLPAIFGEPDAYEDGPPFDGIKTRYFIYRGLQGEEIRVRVLTAPPHARVVGKSFIGPDGKRQAGKSADGAKSSHAAKPASSSPPPSADAAGSTSSSAPSSADAAKSASPSAPPRAEPKAPEKATPTKDDDSDDPFR